MQMQMQVWSVLMQEWGMVFQRLRKTKASLERQSQGGRWSRWRKSFSKGPQAGEVVEFLGCEKAEQREGWLSG